MSLLVFDKYQLENGEIPYDIIWNTSDYFDNNLKLDNTDEVKEIIKEIDGSSWLDEYTVQSWKEPIIGINMRFLSSGCKAVLCCALQSDKVVAHRCCGPNAVFKMLRLNHGMMLYIGSQMPFDCPTDCDINYRDIHFSNLETFLKWRGRHGYDK